MNAEFIADRRGVSVTVNYVLALGILAILVSGLMVGAGGYLDDQRRATTHDELETIGNRLAAQVAQTDSLSRGGGEMSVHVERQQRVASGNYRVELRNGDTCSSPSADACLHLRAPASDVSVRVPVQNETAFTLTRDGDAWVLSPERTESVSSTASRTDLSVQPNIGVGRDVRAESTSGDAVDPRNRDPIAGFTFDPGVPTLGEEIAFQNDTNDLDGRVDSYEWNFGDGSPNESGPTVSHTYDDPGKYDVTLTITDDQGATDTITKRVSVSGVVYEGDAEAVDHDGDGDDGGVEFSLTNQFDADTHDVDDDEVELTEMLVDPDSPALDELDEGSGSYGSEIIVDADERDGYVDYDRGVDVAAGGLVVDFDDPRGDVSGTDVIGTGANPELSSGSSATVVLSEFQNVADVTGEPISVTVRYEVDGDRYATQFVLTPSTTPVGSDGSVEYAINAGGGSYTADDGVTYAADSNTEGSVSTTTDGISGTTDDELYRSERYGEFGYDVPVDDGTYEVTLQFAEIFHTGDGDRQFDVALEGTEVVSNLDVHAEVGHDRAYEVTRTVTVTDGELNVEFDTDVDNAKLSALVVREVSDE
ncbi:hypothetical protein AUR64_10390 [Haloprofundus marisrubri]|uniref:PKD domain-containing protein n=1 Tax=Haloprofundus marisrubri TaxID=1514971 RepID=A0A0W1R8P9_9EURY|nr:malectin domain-containing carbohydrate-binding protein [Haloprofundus marisrubri]KTG10004.1 hypothetical protein AUR64_10390 [Haloprofundus marisrubri]